MSTSKEEIREWLTTGKEMGATHVIVVCDSWDYEDYPVYVMPGEDPKVKAQEYNGKDMQRLMEVYALAGNIELQLGEFRAMHYDNGPEPSISEPPTVKNLPEVETIAPPPPKPVAKKTARVKRTKKEKDYVVITKMIEERLSKAVAEDSGMYRKESDVLKDVLSDIHQHFSS